MDPVFIPAPHNGLLKGLPGPVRLCDYQGNVLGYFTPAEPGAERYPVYEPPPLTEEEYQKLINESESYTTEEVIASLEGFPCSP